MSAPAGGLLGYPWSQVGVLFSFITWPITLAVVIFYNRRPERRIAKMDDPVSAHFVIADKRFHPCSYARQNEHEYLIDTVVLKSNSECIIDLCLKAHVHFKTTQIYLGCFETFGQPVPYEVCNRFIKTGNRRTSVPGEENEDYVDKYGYYHMVEPISWSKGMDKCLGFKFRTGKPGIYTLRIYFNGDEIEPFDEKLQIIVENEPRKRMICVMKSHEALSCAAGIVPHFTSL